MKSLVRRAIRGLGYDIRRRSVTWSETMRAAAMFRCHGVNLILDIGANVGQFGAELRHECGYHGRIVSFEPMKLAHEALYKAAERDKLWTVAPPTAIGATDGEIEINVAGNSVSSSILPMLDAHARAAPESLYAGVEKVPLRKLDSIAPDYLTADSVVFLKVDTQGYERQVLDGGQSTLARAVGIQLELSLIPLYEGQQLMSQMLEYVSDAGFDLWSMSPAFVNPETGRILQIDATFFRRRAE